MLLEPTLGFFLATVVSSFLKYEDISENLLLNICLKHSWDTSHFVPPTATSQSLFDKCFFIWLYLSTVTRKVLYTLIYFIWYSMLKKLINSVAK